MNQEKHETFSTDPKWRKDRPMARGLLDYFPDALAAVAHVSKVGNNQHNPGEEIHWAKDKSTDHADCIVRHLIERGEFDDDGLRHSAKVAWRALAMLQVEIEHAVMREMRDTKVKPAITKPVKSAPIIYKCVNPAGRAALYRASPSSPCRIEYWWVNHWVLSGTYSDCNTPCSEHPDFVPATAEEIKKAGIE